MRLFKVQKKVFLSAVGILLMTLSSAANAQWLAKVEDDDDGRGHTAILLGGEDDGRNILLDCSKDGLKLSYVESRDTKTVTVDLPADLLIKTEDNSPVKFFAMTTVRNESTFALEAKDNEKIKFVLAQLRSAKGNIFVSIHYPMNDYRFTFSMSSTGISQAVGQFTKACNIVLPEQSK